MTASFHERNLFYCETIRETVVADGKIIRRVPVGNEYAHVRVSLEPLKRGRGFEFVEQVTAQDLIPARFLAHIESGVLRGVARGLFGFQLTDTCVTLLDGSYHETDSTPAAFEDAAALAVAEAMRNAKPLILEPILSLSLRIPVAFVGSVVGELSLRRARIEEILYRGREVEVIASVPRSELGNYAADLAVLTNGFGTYSFRLAEYYEELPGSLIVTLFCYTCKREMVLPTIRGEPYSQKCLICGSGLEPPDLTERVGIT